jgi:tetratricopeptide (TPR) repeat protein
MKKLPIILAFLVAVPGLVWAGLYVQRARALDGELSRARGLVGTRQGQALLQELAERYPDHAEVQFLYARSLGLFGQSTAADSRLARAGMLGWPKRQVDRLHAILLAQRTFRGEAEAALQALRDRDDSDLDVLLALANGYSQIRRKMADQLVDEVLSIDPNNGQALCLRAYLILKDEDHHDKQDAVPYVVKAMKQGREFYFHGEARLLLAVCLREQGKYGAALKLYRESWTEERRDARALYGIGLCERYLGHLEKALEAFEEVMRLRPREVEARMHIAYIYEVLNRLPKALEVLRSIEAEDPDEHQMLMQTAKILTKLGDTAQAQKYQQRYEELIRRFQEESRHKSRELGDPPGPVEQTDR